LQLQLQSQLSITNSTMIHYLGYFAGVLTVASFLPQVIRTWRTRHTRDLSLGMFALLVTASTLWIIYGIVIGNWPVILTNLGMVALNGAIGVAKFRFG
jgi:MtN3 and saliva related transmembrane protein